MAGSFDMRDESRIGARRRVCVAAIIFFLLGPVGLSAVSLPAVSAATRLIQVSEALSAGSEAEGRDSSSASDTDTSSGLYLSTLSSKQMSKLKEALQSHPKGAVNFLWLSKVSTQGKRLASAFRDTGWVVASLPIGMGNLPSGITITGRANNVSVAVAKGAFDSSGVKYHYRDDETTTIIPAMMGPCDVAITVSTESK